jgi:hypothetical protein
MSQQKLTKLAVEQIPAQGEDVVVWDTALPGFGVRVKPTGVRSYIIQYRDRTTGASKRMPIGQHGALLTFDQAKKHARGILADALRGQDPVGERRAVRKAPNMANLASDYLDRHAVPKKRPKSVRDDRAMLETVILPAVGTKKVASIERRDIESMHLHLSDRPYQANRVLALISKMLNLAVEWGWRRDNPAKGIQRYREEKRDRWLTDEELSRSSRILKARPAALRRHAHDSDAVLFARLRLSVVVRDDDLGPVFEHVTGNEFAAGVVAVGVMFLRLWDRGDEFCAAAALNDLLRGLARFIKLPMSQRVLIR